MAGQPDNAQKTARDAERKQGGTCMSPASAQHIVTYPDHFELFRIALAEGESLG